MRHDYWIDDDPKQEDPQGVSNLLTKELLQLSLNDRSDIQEEIHGVKCLALEETPELLETSLLELAIALENDDIIPPHKKEAYRKSQHLSKTYVNDDGFRLRFLRFTHFDVKWASEKMVKFLDIILKLFGEFALERAVRLSDFDSRELKYLREGECQFLPFRDRIGRRILVFLNPLMPREDLLEYQICRAKILIYMTWVAADDVDVQRKGLVILVRFTSKYKLSVNDVYKARETPRIQTNIISSVRACAIHICSSDTPLYRFIHGLVMLRIKVEGRERIKIHYGESVQLQYSVHSYGIPTEHIPLTFSGNIKDGYIKQWIKLRAYAESQEYDSEIVECPQLKDVLFRQGASSLSYPGNSRVHCLVEKRYQHDSYQVARRGTVKFKREKVVLEIIEDIHLSGGRFLVWNDHGWWNELLEPGLLATKLEYLIKEVLRSKRKGEKIAMSPHQLKLDSSTSMFRTQYDEGGCSHKRKKLNDVNEWSD